MMRRFGIAVLLAAVWLLPGPAASASGDLSLFGTYTSGDFGTGVEADTQATVLRYSTGDRLQFRIEGSYLRVRSTMPIPAPRSGSGIGPRSGGSGSAGGGQGMPDDPGQMPDPGATKSAWTSGFGDLRFAGFVRLLGGGAKLYRLDTGVGVKAPTASTDDLLGTGEWDYRLSLSGEYRFWSASVFGTLGWNKLGDPDYVDFNDIFDYVAGVDSEPLADKVILSGWIEGNQAAVSGYGDRVAVGVGVRSLGRFRWRALATAGLGGSAEDFSVLFGVSMGVEPPKTGIRGLPF